MINAKDKKTYWDVIVKCPLFTNIPENLIEEMMDALNGKIINYKKNEIVLNAGDPFRFCYLVLSGNVEVSYDTNQYEKHNVNHFETGEIFGEALAIKSLKSSPVQVTALNECTLLLIDINILVTSNKRCGRGCLYNHQLLLNLMGRMAEQNIFSNLKLRILGQKSLRDRIMIYLTSMQQGKPDGVTIPFSQTAFAEFLGVNRSALSRELGRLQDEGFLEVDGKHYKVL